MRRNVLVSLSICVLALAVALPGAAESIKKSVVFQLGEWVDLEFEDGPATLHRMRIVEDQGGFKKSKFFRPGNDEYLETIQIQVEYSNRASRDWEADLAIEWVDSKGRAIDGYNDEETMDEDERRELITVTLSTLRYGLDQAKKLNISIAIYPD